MSGVDIAARREPETGRSTAPYDGGWFTDEYANGRMGKIKESK